MPDLKPGLYSIRGQLNAPLTEDELAQQALDAYISADYTVYHKLLVLAEIIKSLGYVVNPNLVDNYQEISAAYNRRQKELKEGFNGNATFVGSIIQGAKDGWEWLVQQFSIGSVRHMIGAIPLIPVAIAVVVATLGLGTITAYVITRSRQMKIDAETDIQKLDALLTSYTELPQEKAKQLLPYIKQSSQPLSKQKDIFDKATDFVVTGGLIALAIWGVPKAINYFENRKKSN